MSTQTVSKMTNEELFALYLAGDEYAKEELAEINTRLVHYITQGFISTGIPYDELYRNGLYGLTKAIKSFKLDKNTKFATFATLCIRNEILMCVRNEKKHRGVVSLYEPVFDNDTDKALELIDMLPDESFKGLGIDWDAVGSIFNEIYRSLSPRDQLIVKAVIIDEKTQCQVSEMFNLTQSYISRILKSVKTKIRKLAVKQGLIDRVEPLKSRDITEEQYLQIKHSGPDGKALSEKEVAAKLQVSTMTLWNKKTLWKKHKERKVK